MSADTFTSEEKRDSSRQLERMEDLFASYNTQIDKESEVREAVSAAVKNIFVESRNVQFALQRIQTNIAAQKGFQDVLDKAHESFGKMGPCWNKIAETIGEQKAEKYRDHWKGILGQLTFTAAYIHWLDKKTLMTPEEVETELSIHPSIGLDIEDYLIGVAGLPTELSRLCINCVRFGDYQLPKEISLFVNDLYSAFRLLNMRNDALRRKFDSIKYAVNKIEEVLYDISIRKLGGGDEKKE